MYVAVVIVSSGSINIRPRRRVQVVSYDEYDCILAILEDSGPLAIPTIQINTATRRRHVHDVHMIVNINDRISTA